LSLEEKPEFIPRRTELSQEGNFWGMDLRELRPLLACFMRSQPKTCVA